MFSTIWGICFSLKANPNAVKTCDSCTVCAQRHLLVYIYLPTFPHITSSCNLFMNSDLLDQGLSDCEDDPAEGAALNEVTQSIRRFSQRERLCHDGLHRPGLKQWKNDAPRGAPYVRRLCEEGEALHARALPDQICDVYGCLAACGVAQGSQASPGRERAESFAQDFSADCVDHDVGAITCRNPANAVAKLLNRKVDHLIETQGACLLRLRMISRR